MAIVTHPHYNELLCLWLQATGSGKVENFLITQLI